MIGLAAIVRPGDALVISFKQNMTSAEIAQGIEAFAPLEAMGIVVRIVVGASNMVIVRSESTSEPVQSAGA